MLSQVFRPVTIGLACYVICLSAPASAGSEPYVNAANYTSIQAAIDSLPAGVKTVWIPPGRYTSVSSPTKFIAPLRFPKAAGSTAVRIMGAGPGATTLVAANSDSALCVIRASNQQLENLSLVGTGVTGNGAGILVESLGAVIAHASVRNCIIDSTSSWGLYVRGTSSPSDKLAILCTYDNVQISHPSSGGAVRIDRTCTTQYFSNSSFGQFVGYGAQILGASVSFTNCDFEQGDFAPASNEFVYLDSCSGTTFTHCWFEDNRPDTTVAFFVRTSPLTNTITMNTCNFIRTRLFQARALWLDQWTQGFLLINPSFSANDSTGRAFDTRDQIRVRGYSAGLTEGNRVTLTLVSPMTRTARGYYPTTVTDSLGAGEFAQPGIVYAQSLDIGPSEMIASTGSPTRGLTGTPPNAFDRWSMTSGADRVLIFTAYVPGDWVRGPITVKAEYSSIAGSGDNSGCEVDFGYLLLGDGDNPTAAATVLGPVNLPTTSPQNGNVHVVSLGTIPSDIVAGKLMRCYLKRDVAAEVSGGGSANVQTLGLLGVRFVYSRNP